MKLDDIPDFNLLGQSGINQENREHFSFVDPKSVNFEAFTMEDTIFCEFFWRGEPSINVKYQAKYIATVLDYHDKHSQNARPALCTSRSQ